MARCNIFLLDIYGHAVSGARARSIPVDIDIRLYAIGSTDRRWTDVHEKVMEITTMWGSLRLAPIIVLPTSPLLL